MCTIILFTNINSLQDVLSSWVTYIEGYSHCFWDKDDAKVSTMIKKCIPPQINWLLVPCIVKKQVATYQEGRQACKELKNIMETECGQSFEEESLTKKPSKNRD